MGKVISVYNEWAFYEIVLPSASNTEYSFLLDAEAFHLCRNERVGLECVQGRWHFKRTSQGREISAISPRGAAETGSWLPEYGRYRLSASGGEDLTVLVEEKDSPLYVYRKYILAPGQTVSIGLDPDNDICYCYPQEKETASFVSRRHCAIYYDGTAMYLEDTSSNGTYVNTVRVSAKVRLRFGDHVRVFGLSLICMGNVLAVNDPPGSRVRLAEALLSELEVLSAKGDQGGECRKLLFYRAPRSIPKMDTAVITIDPPPNPRELLEMPIFMQIGPAMTMTIPMLLGSGLTVLASRAQGTSGSALMFTGMLSAVASALLGAFWAVMNVRYSRERIRGEEEARFTKYGQYLIEKQRRIAEIYDANTKALCEKYPSSEAVAEYSHAEEKLWCRNFNHSDVLTYRLGLGDVPSPAPIEVPKERFTLVDDSLAEKPKLIQERFSMLRGVPFCVDLRERSLVGVIGEANAWAQVIKNLIVQIAGNNSYTDVKLAFAYDGDRISNVKTWEFVKWLPHVWSEDKKIRYFATDKNEAGEVFYSLGQVMRTRTEEGGTVKPYYVLIVLNKELLEGELIAKYIGEGSSGIGLSTVIAAQRYEELPNHCEFIIENNQSFAGVYRTTDEDTDRYCVDFDSIPEDRLNGFARRLANIEINEVESGGELPGAITFFDMYGISSPRELCAAERWRRSRTAESMKALIGVKSGGAPCYLDVHERYHGPHGLVAGTTGSGKSETLQTYMLSLAISYSPDDVGFFIIDYKGGGMANLFEGLPHMIGAISNLSGNQVKRAMVSIKSENKRRQRVFTYYGVNNINAYTSLYKEGSAKEPVPHLFIIIDEFAELKREEPDFMRELVSVAQVGRSLGVHLILATQKPAGTVDDNIWSNSKFRLCLRVQDRQDSMDMLHRADAAYLTQAGRGFLQVGNDELFELFQSGYSGAVYDETLGNKKLVVAQMLDAIGKVDLVGSHFKIQYQNEARHSWIKTVLQALRFALERNAADEAGESAFLGNAGSSPYISSLLGDVYTFMKERNIDYRRSPHNDARLQEFFRLYSGTEGGSEDERADAIIDAAARQGLRLPEARAKSQLEAVNEYLAETARREGYARSLQLWMPVLPERMLLTDIAGYRDFALEERALAREEERWSLSAVIGKGDDPENQSQMPIVADFGNNGHHAVCGTVSTGKSTFLQTLVYALINKYTAEEVNLYIIDFSSKLLTVFAEARQVGGVMTEEDGEKLAKFFTMIHTMIDERKKLLASSNYRDYVEHSGRKLPAVLIVIDNYAGFREKTGEQYEEIIKLLAKEGISYGFYLAVTAGGFGTAEISSRLADNFRTTVSLEMSDIYQYGDVLRTVRVPVCPESNVKGRGLVFYGERIIEFQTALACAGESTFERNDMIRKRIAQINRTDTGRGARKIPVIPQKPVWEEYTAEEDYAKLIGARALLPNGYDAETAAYCAIDLTNLLTYVVSGTKKSGKSTYLKTLIRAGIDKGSDVCIIEIGSGEFARIAADTGCRYVRDGQGIFEFARDVLLQEVGLRAEKKKECMALHMEDADFYDAMSCYRRLCIFVPNATGFLGELYSRDSPAHASVNVYETLCGDKGFHYNFHFFIEVGDSEAGEIFGYPCMAGFKENGTGIRFGGKYLSQRLFNYSNVSYKLQGNALKPGIGVVPSDDEHARLEQVVVPNYRG